MSRPTRRAQSCSSSPRRTIGVAPSSATPTSKEIRVRVEGCSKTRPTLRPASALGAAAVSRPRFQLRARGRAACPSSNAPSSSPVRKCRFKPRILRAVQFTAITWNLFHGRDFPPDPALFTWRSRLLRVDASATTRTSQVNREPLRRVRRGARRRRVGRRAAAGGPPRFAAPLAEACGAEAHRVAHLAQLRSAPCAPPPPASTPT